MLHRVSYLFNVVILTILSFLSLAHEFAATPYKYRYTLISLGTVQKSFEFAQVIILVLMVSHYLEELIERCGFLEHKGLETAMNRYDKKQNDFLESGKSIAETLLNKLRSVSDLCHAAVKERVASKTSAKIMNVIDTLTR